MAKTVSINILGNPAQAIAALEAVGVKAEETAAKTDSAGVKGAAAGEAIGKWAKWAVLGVAALGVGAVKLGADLQEAHRNMVVAITDTGASYARFAPQIAKADKAMENFGFTNQQTEEALAIGVVGTHNTTKALSYLSIAADLARYKHMSLADAMTLVVKGGEGMLRPLRALGIDLPVAAGNALQVKKAHEALAKAEESLNAILKATPDAIEASSKAHAKYEAALAKVQAAQQKVNDVSSTGAIMIDTLRQRLAGQAADSAQTFSGRLNVMRARVEDVGARIGIALIPILEKLMTIVAGVVGWLDKHRVVAEMLGAVIGTVLVVALGYYVAGMIAAAAATIAATWPILLIIVAVAALAAGIVWLATHWKQAWADIKHWFDEAVQFLRSGLGTLGLLLLGPIGVLAIVALHWHDIWDGIKQAFSDAKEWFRIAVRDFVGFFTAIPGEIAGLANDIYKVATSIGIGLADGVIWGINQIITGWDFLVSHIGFSVPSWIPLIGGKHWDLGQVANLSTIPYLDTGGIVTGPAIAALSMNRVPEAVIPLPTLSSMLGGAGGGGPVTFVFEMNGREVAKGTFEDMRTMLLQYSKRNSTRVIG